jgi:hypothetical protein
VLFSLLAMCCSSLLQLGPNQVGTVVTVELQMKGTIRNIRKYTGNQQEPTKNGGVHVDLFFIFFMFLYITVYRGSENVWLM